MIVDFWTGFGVGAIIMWLILNILDLMKLSFKRGGDE